MVWKKDSKREKTHLHYFIHEISKECVDFLGNSQSAPNEKPQETC